MTLPTKIKRFGAVRSALLALVVVTAILAPGDRSVFSAPASYAGIDPLEILNLGIRSNILFIVDTSGSMAGVPEDSNRVVGGDDPGSRFYQVKRAVREVIAANAGKANFGLATFHPDRDEHQIDGGQGLVYVSQDPNAAVWMNKFNNVSSTFANYNEGSVCTGAAGACTAAASTGTQGLEVFRGLQSNESATNSAYPAGCSNQPNGNHILANGTANGGLMDHTYGTHCRYYIKSRLFRNGVRYYVNSSAPNPVQSTEAITCPAPPRGLLGDDVNAFNSGGARACFQIRETKPGGTNNDITTYWLTGTNFDFVNVNSPAYETSTGNCGQSGTLIDVSDCQSDNSAAIQAEMRMELQYDANGVPFDIPGVTDLTNRKPQSSAFQTPAYQNVGIRQGNGTPLAGSMAAALAYYKSSVFTNAKRPAGIIGKQKNFVILLTDGDESCSGDAPAAARALWNNTASPAQPTVTGVANRIELLLITFAGGTPANANAIAKAGSGLNSDGTCQVGAPCRNAFIANDLTALINALNAAIVQSADAGEFSDQQSITETVYEYVHFAPTPNPSPSPVNPPAPYVAMNPKSRYFSTVPILLQSTFEMPNFKGHLNAFRNDGTGSSVELWDAGEQLFDRVINDPGGMGATNTTYTFAQLYGNATIDSVKGSTARIKRRIFTTASNGVLSGYTASNLFNAGTASAATALGANRVALWPPAAAVAPTGNVSTNPAGSLDAALGLAGLTTLAQVQALVPGVCLGAAPASCGAGAGQMARARREAREIMLAALAGAQLDFPEGGVPNRSAGELLYIAKDWFMAESTLAAPGVVTPPLLTSPAFKSGEYRLYRDGPRKPGSTPASPRVAVDDLVSGFGLRNADFDGVAATAADVNIKPVMSVVYHATNAGLHAFRAGPCPTVAADGSIGVLSLPCTGETGGEEMWLFVPFDQLGKLPNFTKDQERGNKTYMMAAPVRFSDIFVPSSTALTRTYGASPNSITETLNGVWRTILFAGRGAGGMFMTALDVTVPGSLTRHSLETTLPSVVWSRGNFDTNDGLVKSGANSYNNTLADYNGYLTMGETWSVPAIGYVDSPATHATTRKAGGMDYLMFMGSGYGPTDPNNQGKNFYVMDPLTGDIVRRFDVGDNAGSVNPNRNSIVASPSVYSTKGSGASLRSPIGFKFAGNPIDAVAKFVYFGDLQGRVFRYDLSTAAAAATAPAVVANLRALGENDQPLANGLSLLHAAPAVGATPGPLVFFEAGNDSRVPLRANPPFRMYAYKDDIATSPATPSQVFKKDFPNGYRGTTAPVAGFALDSANQPFPIVFYAGTKFNATGPTCVSSFDSIIFGLRALQGDAAFDFNLSGDDSYVTLTGERVNQISLAGGELVVDRGTNAQVPPSTIEDYSGNTGGGAAGGASGSVSVGLTPGTKAFDKLGKLARPMKDYSSVCKGY